MNPTQQSQPIIFERFLTEAEEKQLFKTVGAYKDIHARRDAHWMMLMRQTGIRVGSMAGLTVRDAKNAIVSRRLTLPDAICKGGRGYAVALNERAVRALRGLLRIRHEQGHAIIMTAPLVMSRHHQALAIRTYQARMKKWVNESGLDVPATPHFFRHTVGRRIMDKSSSRNPQRTVQSVLHHASLNTSSVYTQPSREDVELVMKEIA